LTYRLLIRARAERDIARAQLWYEGQRRGLGAQFRFEVDKILTQLRDNPFIYPRIEERARRAVLQRFPYLLYYLVDGDRISVIACFHGHRDPDLLRSRLR
jgi:plasmid stabilization system protein ParE